MLTWANYLLRTEHMLIMLAVSALIALAERFWPALERDPLWARSLPALPVLGCSIAVWFPGLVAGGTAERILLGIVLGAVCGHAYKLTTQSILGNDRRIRDHPTRL